jgi:WD40 repeat protein
MKICFVGTNFDKFPILNDLMKDMEESGEEIVLFNWFAKQTEEFEIEADAYIYVDIYPLRTDKPCAHLTRGMDDDGVMACINALANSFSSSGKVEVQDDITTTIPEDVPFDITPTVTEDVIVITKEIDAEVPKLNITGFNFVIDGKRVFLSKSDTDYLISVFNTAKENGYRLEKVITDEDIDTESGSEDNN